MPFHVPANPFGSFAHLFSFDHVLKSCFLLISMLVLNNDRSVSQTFHEKNSRNFLFSDKYCRLAVAEVVIKILDKEADVTDTIFLIDVTC